jgi:hypothetical protein
VVDAERLQLQKVAGSDGAGAGAALVPKTWTLSRRRMGGADETLATNVVSYDLCPDGGVVYTNGSTIYRLASDGAREEICAARLIERVVSL